MTDEELWNDEREVCLVLGETPDWVEDDVTVRQLMAITQGGCASGAYMPAVTYFAARKTMNAHGDAVLQFIEDNYGELPQLAKDESWSGIAVFYLSCGVELWASAALSELRELES